MEIKDDDFIGSGSQDCRLGVQGKKVFIEVEFSNQYEALVAFEDFAETLRQGRGILIGQAKDMKKES